MNLTTSNNTNMTEQIQKYNKMIDDLKLNNSQLTFKLDLVTQQVTSLQTQVDTLNKHRDSQQAELAANQTTIKELQIANNGYQTKNELINAKIIELNTQLELTRKSNDELTDKLEKTKQDYAKTAIENVKTATVIDSLTKELERLRKRE